jgi:integrase
MASAPLFVGIADFQFHDLWHTVAMRLCQAGRNPYMATRLQGHQDPKMTQRYAHHWTESLRNAFRVVTQRQQMQRSRCRQS